MDETRAEQLLAKLRHFIATDLDPDERALLGALLAPGVASAQTDAQAEAEVAGFEMGVWRPQALPEALVNALRGAQVRVEGLGL